MVWTKKFKKGKGNFYGLKTGEKNNKDSNIFKNFVKIDS